MRADGRLGVVTLIDRLVHGGAERLAAQIATRLDPQRFASTLCVTRWSDPSHAASGDLPQRLRAEADAAGVQFLGLHRDSAWDLRAWSPLVRLLRTGDVQIVHGHLFGSTVWAVVLGRLTRVPVVVAHDHGRPFTGHRLRGIADRRLIAPGSDALIACSQEDRRRMIERHRIAAAAIRLVPNGIDGRSPTPGRDVRAELGIAKDAAVIGSVGALRSVKRFDVLLRAAAELALCWPGLRVVLAGEGPERAQLEALAAELGLGDTLLMLGARSDVTDILQALDVAVVCSDNEGSPLSVMEYMEAGLPVVATAVGGLPQMIHDGVHGLLVPRRDVAGLASAIEALLADPQRGRELGAAGRERRRSEYDLGVMVGRIEALYEQLYAARSGAPPLIAT